MDPKDVHAFFERVADDWDTMRLACYHERVIERLAAVSGAVGVVMIVDDVDHPYRWMREEHADVWPGFEVEQIEGSFREVGQISYR